MACMPMLKISIAVVCLCLSKQYWISLGRVTSGFLAIEVTSIVRSYWQSFKDIACLNLVEREKFMGVRWIVYLTLRRLVGVQTGYLVT